MIFIYLDFAHLLSGYHYNIRKTLNHPSHGLAHYAPAGIKTNGIHRLRASLITRQRELKQTEFIVFARRYQEKLTFMAEELTEVSRR